MNVLKRNMKNNETYTVELNRQELVLLGHLVLSQKLYNTSYEPLKNLCDKIDGICQNFYINLQKNNVDEIPGE